MTLTHLTGVVLASFLAASAAFAQAPPPLPSTENGTQYLVFFRSHGHVYHVGIYAGHGRVWHAPRPGRRVGLAHIWTRHVSYGRAR